MNLTPWRPPPFTGEAREVVVPHRRAQVLAGICRGKGNGEIGADLFVSEQTVKTHVSRLLHDLGATNRCHAAWLVLTGRVAIYVPEEG